MGRTWEMEGTCKIHPVHTETKGVCPFCLRERLARLAADPSSSTDSSTVDLFGRSDAASPLDKHRTTKKLLQLLKGKKQPLRRSASLSLAAGDAGEGHTKEKKQENNEKKMVSKSKKDGGLWLKLMLAADGRRQEEKGGLCHSMTMKEKHSSKWTIF